MSGGALLQGRGTKIEIDQGFELVASSKGLLTASISYLYARPRSRRSCTGR